MPMLLTPYIRHNFILKRKDGTLRGIILDDITERELLGMKKYDLDIWMWTDIWIISDLHRFIRGRKHVEDLKKMKILEFSLPNKVMDGKTNKGEKLIDKIVGEIKRSIKEEKEQGETLDFKIVLTVFEPERDIEIDPEKL